MNKGKSTQEEKQLHSLVLEGDDLALAKLYDLFGESIILSLKNWYNKVSRTDDALILEAVNEAFLGYYRNPNTFDSNKNSLKRFLEIASERDLKNILEKEKKHMNKKELPEDVELQEKFWNSTIVNADSTDYEIIQDETLNKVEEELIKHFHTPLDVSLAKMILQKERKTFEFAKVLDLENLSSDEQKKQVKKHKDRIKKVLERYEVEEKLKKLTQ